MNDGPASSSTVQFNNTMRSRTYNNAQFYRNGNEMATSDSETISHRINIFPKKLLSLIEIITKSLRFGL